ncbi:disease resistance protein RPP13 [Arachis duranensis]|uniref:Disease resistance protein RPP13 n=1 Tax=Arachis duranensis TaxID=130453 RepID=A0A6P4DBQ4_ARADU|nr:disease resistance protein RPP13 [Arachis duranensis]XP_052117197.1 disease resistance protein RPP13 [Arachis duranensis]
MAGSSSSDQGVSHFKYDVFLSFRGYTRLEFTDALYHALINRGIHTFRDNDELRIGEELEGALLEAIERSRMSILVLCDEYPTSKWCLDELVKIMECSGNGTKRPVLPVYFRVAKSDVQFQKNKYETAMAAHQVKGRYNHKLEAWRSALSRVGKIYGQRCDQNTPFGIAINNIVQEVIEGLPPLPLYIHHPLGCDSKLEEAKSFLQIGSSDASRLMLGIHGDGDLSQFVAELYNKIRCDFATASFLSGISKKTNASGGGLEDLQKTLLSEMKEKVKNKIGSTFRGSSEIKQRLGKKGVLLILDDVDNIQQLKSLAGEIDWFGPGSRIIITTRYEDVLDEHAGVDIKKYRFDEGEFEGHRGENVVGLEEDLDVIINQLKEEDSARNVVSIVGMGGLGKTTLARKVYNSDEARELFPCRAWATVSKECMPTEVFKNLLKCLKVDEAEYKKADEEKLKDMVRKRLNGKKYLVVLDDIWEANVWDKVKGPLPDNNNGSMILVTTRNDRMANYARSKEPHHQLHFLDEDQSWEMFRNKVFGREECPPPLELIGRSIAFESCKGLPLAIKTIAGIVAKKGRSKDAWEEIKDLLPYWSVAEDPEGKEMMKILKYSYDDLPEKMKPFFLYLGVFPEDVEIRVRDLIHVWMAEGFLEPIQTGRSKPPPEPEDIGEQYLKELVDRNLVQVAKRRSDGKGVKTCQIHDLIRDLCILVSKDNPDNSNNARRFTFFRSIGSYACSVTCNHSSTCSLFVYGNVDGWSNHIPADCPVNVLYLNGLDGELTFIENAQYLERLKSIKFLKMDYAALHRLFRLQSLQTMHVISTFDREKISVKGLKQMRHFRCHSTEHLLVNERVKHRMENVQTLFFVSADSQLGILLNNGCFPNLRTLGLVISEDEGHLVDVNLRSLHRLSELRKLKLEFDISVRVPLGNITFPSNLSKIVLTWCNGLEYQDMNALGRIRRLQILKLYEVGCSQKVLNCGSAGSFPQLQVFIMIFVNVTCVTLEDGAMPRLRRAVFRECPGLMLQSLPEQMLSLDSNLHFIEYKEERRTRRRRTRRRID